MIVPLNAEKLPLIGVTPAVLTFVSTGIANVAGGDVQPVTPAHSFAAPFVGVKVGDPPAIERL